MPRRNTPRGKRQPGPPQGQASGIRFRDAAIDPWIGAANPPPAPGPFARASSRGGHTTLADEARNTAQRPRGFFGQDAKLRHKPITFVSAGFMDPLKDLEFKQPKASPPGPAKETIRGEEPRTPAVPIPASARAILEEAPEEFEEEEETEATHIALSADLFMVDTSGDKLLRPEHGKSVVIPVIPDEDGSGQETDSSEEVILFKGRDARRQAAASQPIATHSPPKDHNSFVQLHEMDAAIKIVEKTITPEKIVTSVLEQSAQQEIKLLPIRGDSPAVRSVSPEKDPSLHEALLNNFHSDEEAAIIADYIANMDNEEEDDEESDVRPGLGSHAFHMLRDLGGTDSDAVPEIASDDESNGDKSVGEANIGEASDAQRRRMEFEDERMARMLAKQEELGLGDDVILFDDADAEDGQGDWQIAPKSTPRRTKKGSSKKSRIIQKKGQFPSATQMANAFEDLDLMDWNRAALDTFNQAASRAKGAPHVSDSELDEAMQMSFQKDRLKKADKKKQREALRAMGLLGKNVDPDDLRVKYPAGMSPDDLEYELEQFLVGTDEQISLPPLDKHARKIIHLVARQLNLKSASAGSGNSRHPVLYRTGRTRFHEQSFESTMNRFSKQPYFTRTDVDKDFAKQHRALQGMSNQKRARLPRSNNATSYREGEIVGQHAAELGLENKGRLLLEKMGWSKGMALGTEENKGIMVPISHAMKKGKAGLAEA